MRLHQDIIFQRINSWLDSRSKLDLDGNLSLGNIFDGLFLAEINISSQIDGQTQTDWPIDQEESFFNHLIDIHYGTRGIQVHPNSVKYSDFLENLLHEFTDV